MYKIFFVILFLFSFNSIQAQLEISSGFAINKQLATGAPIQIGYSFKLKNKIYTKSQIGYKYLHYYNDYVDANLNVSILEFHQTITYEVIKNKKYIFSPNVGLNFRFYKWNGKLNPPYNTLPQRAWKIGVRNGSFILDSYNSGRFNNTYKSNNLGFSFQFQNQFKLTNKTWMHITPFIEPDYDRSQNSGGVYLGIIFKNF